MSNTQAGGLEAHRANALALRLEMGLPVTGMALPDGLMRNPATAEKRPGEISWSFANVLRLVRPVMIVDEAHNFVTGLSEETGGRLDPSAIIEFTATPLQSNVIVSATADELKAEQMIKLPIHLTQHTGWESAIIHALQQRAGLDRIATDANEPIRPIALYRVQARTEGAEATVDVVKAKLIEHGIVEEAIAVATGDQRELDGIDLFAPDCKIERVITVEALREGWDCSFAYVFCSVANIQSATAVQQLLGRVLRMPFARRRPVEELNRACAHVTGIGFHAAANKLKDTLVAMGFDERTARDEIIAQRAADAAAAVLPMPGHSPLPPVSLPAAPDVATMPLEVRDAPTIVGEGEGVSFVINPDASDEVLDQIGAILAPLAGDNDPSASIAAHEERRQAAATPSQRGESFTIPGMVLEQYGELDLVEPTTLLDLAGWTLDGIDPSLPGFALSEAPDVVTVDVADGQVRISREASQQILQLEDETAWTAADLSRWLDRTTSQIDISQPVFLEYCRRVVVNLVDNEGVSLAALVRAKDVLRRAIADRVKQLRAEAGHTGMQMLLGDIAPSLGLGENAFRFEEGRYQPPRPYSGNHIWKKHFYPRPDDLRDGGEEFRCAVALDDHPDVKHWVRNIVRGPHSYWLPDGSVLSGFRSGTDRRPHAGSRIQGGALGQYRRHRGKDEHRCSPRRNQWRQHRVLDGRTGEGFGLLGTPRREDWNCCMKFQPSFRQTTHCRYTARARNVGRRWNVDIAARSPIAEAIVHSASRPRGGRHQAVPETASRVRPALDLGRAPAVKGEHPPAIPRNGTRRRGSTYRRTGPSRKVSTTKVQAILGPACRRPISSPCRRRPLDRPSRSGCLRALNLEPMVRLS